VILLLAPARADGSDRHQWAPTVRHAAGLRFALPTRQT